MEVTQLLPDILYFGMNDWNGIRQRSQHMATALSAIARVYYIEPCFYSLAGAIRDKILGRSRRPSISYHQRISETLTVLGFPPLFPKGPSQPAIMQANYELLRPLMRRAFRQHGVKGPILWLSNPHDGPLVSRFGQRLTVYDCMDDHPLFFEGRARQRVDRVERALVRQCDVLLASSETLQLKWLAARPSAQLVRNGVELDAFRVVRDDPGIADNSPPLRRPLCGYVGTIGAWFDQELIVRLAEAMPHIQIQIAGPVATNVERLKSQPNVVLTGSVGYEKIPALINSFDVCLLPFIINDLTTAVDPLKVYEYFALGKPVVATPLPALSNWSHLLYLADSAATFIGGVRDAVAEHEPGNEDRRRLRVQAAEANTWDHRALEVAGILERAMQTERG